MAMARQSVRGWWSELIRQFSGETKKPTRRRSDRRLGAELLENRNLMSVAPLGDITAQSLADYLAQTRDGTGGHS